MKTPLVRATLTLRLPVELHRQLSDAAVDEGRSLTSEIVQRLKRSFEAAGSIRIVQKGLGYLINGVTAGDTTYGTYNYNVGTYCPSGEHFAGWVDAAHAYQSVTAPGGVLQVSNGTKTAALPTV